MGILIAPIITEKQAAVTETRSNRYGFKVVPSATKYQIKKAVEDMYGVHVKQVNTINYPGKKYRRFTKAGAINGSKSSYKKAIVTLAEDQVIDFYENI